MSGVTVGLERYKEAMWATAAVRYPPPPPVLKPVTKPKRRLPPRAKMAKVQAPQGYMFIGPHAVPVGARASVLTIQAAVAKHYGIPPEEMTSQRQGREVARPRQVAMYLSKQLTPSSLSKIGRRFGGRDHTTVIHAIRAVEHRRASNPDLDRDIRLIRSKLRIAS